MTSNTSGKRKPADTNSAAGKAGTAGAADEKDTKGDTAVAADDTKIGLVRRWPTVVAGIIVFVSFAGLVLLLRGAAAIDSRALGVTVWTEREPTEGRLVPVVDSALHPKAIAATLAKATASLKVESPDTPPKWGEALNAIGDALAEDEAKAGLVSAWARELGRAGRLDSVRPKIKEYVLAAAPQESLVTEVAEEYRKALDSATPRWLSSVLPLGAIHGFLNEQQIAVRGVDPAPLIHGALLRYLSGLDLSAEIRDVLESDLRMSSAQSTIVKAVEHDFAARWMWIVAAAVFLTAALSAVVGAAWQVFLFAGRTGHRWLIAVFVAVVGLGLALSFRIQGAVPPFIAHPLREFSGLYGLDAGNAALLLNLGAAVAIAALLVTSWGSFAFKIKNEDDLDVQLGTLRWSLHTATFVLVSGVLALYAYLQWPSSFMGSAAAELIQGGARTSAIALGAAFSTLLMLMYLPGASVLAEEARQLVKADSAKKDAVGEILERHGFNDSFTQQGFRVLQVFLPLLIAPLGAEVISVLGS